MPEYLAPGVFVEEVSFRAKSIEGVPTSTTGFTGMTGWGPVYYPDGPKSSGPRLITSFTEFERVYGGLEPLHLNANDPTAERVSYTAHAARAFFDNGGRRLYISRAFAKRSAGKVLDQFGIARLAVPVGGATATWQARWPGERGNVKVDVSVTIGRNVAFTKAGVNLRQATGVKNGAVVVVYAGTSPPDPTALNLNNLRVVSVNADGVQKFVDNTDAEGNLGPADNISLIELTVTVTVDSERQDTYEALATAENQKRYVGHILQKDDPEDEDAMIWLNWKQTKAFDPARLALALAGVASKRLTGGHDGVRVSKDDLAGKAADPDKQNIKATGLEALAEVEEISIVALPDSGDFGSNNASREAAATLVAHAEKMRYRIAVVDGPKGSSINEIREFRGQFDSKYAALYHPWIEISDPTERPAQGAPPKRLLLPPSGFVTGIYVRNDIERGVHKAPANEIVRGLVRFESNINTPRQEVLNPEGINALRFFEGRGYRVWGARTISSDPEWKYVNVRRLFAFIERAIDVGTQWVVFEPNNERLWANVRRTIEDFLLVLWRDGMLLGDKPEQAYFVRCDRTTMTQNDLDNGRLICLIGVAPVKPAEFVIFRIGQWTGDSAAAA